MRYRRLLVASVALAGMSGCASRTYQLQAAGGVAGLARVTSDDEHEFGPQVNRQGTTLLFDTRVSRNAAVIGIDPASGARRTVYTSANSRAQEVAWDPTGSFFVYTSNSTGVWSLVRSLSNSANAAVSIIVGGELAPFVAQPDVSPDGQSVAFSTFIRDVWHIATANLDGTNFTLIGEGFDPAWSPDGNTLAFVRGVNRRAQVFSVDAATGANLTQITSGDIDNIDPSWSPSGDYIVFASNRTARRAAGRFDIRRQTLSGQFNLFVVRPDGLGLVQLTDGNGIAIDPTWSMDGWIYFSSNQAGNFDVWRLRPPTALGGTVGSTQGAR